MRSAEPCFRYENLLNLKTFVLILLGFVVRKYIFDHIPAKDETLLSIKELFTQVSLEKMRSMCLSFPYIYMCVTYIINLLNF